MASQITDKCTNCGACLPVCPTKSIYTGAKKHVIDHDSCLDCQNCVPVCPVDAIRPAQKEKKK